MNRTSNISNKLAAALATIGVLTLTVTPAVSLAATATDKGSGFCSALSSEANDVNSRVKTLANKANTTWSNRSTKFNQLEQLNNQDVNTDRQKADAERQQDFTKLMNRAKTDTEKQAVQNYETAVNAAVSTRRSAYDTARQTFWQSVQSVIGDRQSTVLGQLSDFQNSVSSAFQTAEASCNSDPNSSTTIHQTLQASLKSARQAFQNDRQGDAAVGQQVKQLVATRQSAFKAADTAFQASLKTARTTLKQAFGGSGSSI